MENTYQTYYNQNSKTTGILFKARHFLPSQTPAGRGTWEFPGGDVLLGPWNP